MSKHISRKRIIVFISVVLMLQLGYLAVNHSQTGVDQGAPAHAPDNQDGFRTEIVRFEKRNKTLLNRAKILQAAVESEAKQGRVLADPMAKLVIDVAIQAIPIRLKQLEMAKNIMVGDENNHWNESLSAFHSLHSDLFDAYLAYVFELRSLAAVAEKMEAKVGPKETDLMKQVASVNVVRRHGDRIRAAWNIPAYLNIEGMPESPVGNLKKLKLFRDWTVYDWRIKADKKDRLEMATLAATYYSKQYPRDMAEWAKSLVNTLPEREAPPTNLVAGSVRPPIERSSVIGSIKALLSFEK